MKKPVKKVCAYCQGSGYSKRLYDRYGWMIMKQSTAFIPSEPVYQCPYCGGPAGSEKNDNIMTTAERLQQLENKRKK